MDLLEMLLLNRMGTLPIAFTPRNESKEVFSNRSIDKITVRCPKLCIKNVDSTLLLLQNTIISVVENGPMLFFNFHPQYISSNSPIISQLVNGLLQISMLDVFIDPVKQIIETLASYSVIDNKLALSMVSEKLFSTFSLSELEIAYDTLFKVYLSFNSDDFIAINGGETIYSSTDYSKRLKTNSQGELVTKETQHSLLCIYDRSVKAGLAQPTWRFEIRLTKKYIHDIQPLFFQLRPEEFMQFIEPLLAIRLSQVISPTSIDFEGALLRIANPELFSLIANAGLLDSVDFNTAKRRFRGLPELAKGSL